MARKPLSFLRRVIVLLILTALVSGERTAASNRSGRDRVLLPCGPMSSPRASHTATRLPDGRVLVAGGMERNGVFLDTAELFDPATGLFSPTPPLSARRVGHTATALPDGTVLIVGGLRGRRLEGGRWFGDALATAEIYEPARGRFVPVGPPGSARTSHAAVRLSGGEVLIAGGSDGHRALSSAEIYDPATRRFRSVGPLAFPAPPTGPSSSRTAGRSSRGAAETTAASSRTSRSSTARGASSAPRGRCASRVTNTPPRSSRTAACSSRAAPTTGTGAGNSTTPRSATPRRACAGRSPLSARRVSSTGPPSPFSQTRASFSPGARRPRSCTTRAAGVSCHWRPDSPSPGISRPPRPWRTDASSWPGVMARGIPSRGLSRPPPPGPSLPRR